MRLPKTLTAELKPWYFMSIEHQDFYQAHAKANAESTPRPFTPSAEELDVLAEHEPDIGFRVLTGVPITEGRQSRVSVLEYEHEDSTYRLIWKRMGAGKNLDGDEARVMRDSLAPYRRSLELSGWTIPKIFNATVVKTLDEFQIYSYEEFIAGGDGERMVADVAEPNFRKWYLIEKVLRLLLHYPEDQLRRGELHGRELTLLPHGLDLKLANVVLEKDTNQLYFVDLFGPKELEDDHWRIYSPKLDQLPPDNLQVVCATREGAILRFWRLAQRSWERDRSRRLGLRSEFLERLFALDPPDEEYRLIRSEIEAGFPWLNQLYQEHGV
jgi:hypothetical protein